MTLRTRLVGVLLALALALVGCSGGDDDSSHADGHGDSSRPADVNDADVMFAAMMIPHHEQAIEMSDLVLAKDGVDARVVALAEQIKAAQQPEIDRMQGWLDGWGGPDHSTMDHGGGMLGQEEMAALEAADGPSASRLFLAGMIAHHEGAIDMAQDEIDDGSRDEAIELARAIVATQKAEIAQMNDLLESL